MSLSKTFKLRAGYEVSSLIRGGWQLAGGHGQVERTQVISDMETFVEAGITTIDCADISVDENSLKSPTFLPDGSVSPSS